MITELVQKLYNYTRTARLTADEHADALKVAQELVAKFAELSVHKEELPPPVVEKLGTEPKIVG
jgi:hypothetical protein